MRLSHAQLLAPVLLATLLVPSLPAQVSQSKEESATMEQPLAVVAAGSVQRLLTDVRYVFDLAGRADISEQLENMLKGIGDLKGLHREKPLGAMIYLRSGLPPIPEIIGFVPVDNIEDLRKTVSIGGRVTTKKLVEEGRYEIVGIQGEFQVLLRNGYAFITNDAELLERNFPDPAKATRRLTSKYDLGATLNLDSIPPGMRSLFMNLVKSSAMSEMQQRDNEPIGQYKIRRSQAEGTLEGLTQLVSEGERLTIGVDADPEKSQVALEFAVDAQENSRFAKELRDIGSKPSYFEPLINEKSPLTLSVSFPILEKDKERLKETLTGIESEIEREFTENQGEDVLPEALAEMMQSLRDTVDGGHLNMFLQFYGEPGEFVIVGGARLVDANGVGRGFKDLLERFKDEQDVGRVTLDAVTHRDVTFHHIESREVDEGGEAMFGDQLGLYVGTGSNVMWMAVGGSAAMDKLKELMDKMAAPKTTDRDRRQKAPFRLVFNMRQWLGLDDDGEGIAFDAFEDSGDQLVVDVRPTESGMRFRLQAEEGFAKLLGLAVGRNFDRQAERRERRRRQRAERP